MDKFEYILLRNLLKNPEFFNKVITIIEPKYFLNPGNKKIFEIIKTHFIDYSSIPNITELQSYIKEIPTETLKNQVIESLREFKDVEILKTDFMCDRTIEFVKDAIFTEALLLGSDALSEKNDKKRLKSRELMEEMSKISISSDLGLDFDDIETMIKYYKDKLLGILTQHFQLNKRLGSGFLPGTLNIIMAASGVGKSLLMTDLISGHIKDNKNVLLISMEMRSEEIMKRVHSNILNLPINSLRDLDEQVIESAYKRLNHTGKFYVKDYPAGSFTPLMLDSLLDNYKNEENIEFDIIYLDYIGIMASDLISPSVGLYSYVKSIVEETRAIAVKKKVPIVTAQQLNRSSYGQKDADNSAVSDSIGSVMTADFILFLLQNEEMKEQGLMNLKVTKNRYTGRTDSWDMFIDYNYMRFTDKETAGIPNLQTQPNNQNMQNMSNSTNMPNNGNVLQGFGNADLPFKQQQENVKEIKENSFDFFLDNEF